MSFLIPGTFLALFIVVAILFFGIRVGRPSAVARRNPEERSGADAPGNHSAPVVGAT